MVYLFPPGFGQNPTVIGQPQRLGNPLQVANPRKSFAVQPLCDRDPRHFELVAVQCRVESRGRESLPGGQSAKVDCESNGEIWGIRVEGFAAAWGHLGMWHSGTYWDRSEFPRVVPHCTDRPGDLPDIGPGPLRPYSPPSGLRSGAGRTLRFSSRSCSSCCR